MELMIVVRFDKEVAQMLCRCSETFKTTSERSKKLVLVHAPFEILTLNPLNIKNEKFNGCMTTEIQIVSSIASTFNATSIKVVAFEIGTTDAFQLLTMESLASGVHFPAPS